LAVFLLIVLAAIHGAFPRGSVDSLEVVATAEEADTWTVTGRILQSGNAAGNGAPAKGTVVWVVAKTTFGNEASYFADPDDSGQFRVSFPRKLRFSPVVALSVVARTPAGSRVEKSIFDERLRSIGGYLGVLSGVLVFVASLFLPFLRGAFDYRRYVLALILACAFTVAMIVSLGMALRRVNTPGRQDDVTPIPFGSVYWGSYDSSARPEWLFSLTSPPAVSERRGQPPEPQAGSGFGAPLWVLLMSVVGAGVLTVSLIVGEIGSPPGDDPAEIRRRIQKVVHHQFFILFAPMGAIFVYQMLVAAQAVGNNVTVAIAAVGSGITLNSLLNVAIRRATGVIEGYRRSSAGSASASQTPRQQHEPAAVTGAGRT
jgi:hypothetical protein